MKRSNPIKEYFAPIIVLVLICFAVTFLLSYIYGVTKPIIDTNNAKAASENRSALLPQAAGDFDEFKGELFVYEDGKVYVQDCYTAKNKSGVVITVVSNSYGGPLTAMVGIDKDGAITNVKVTEASDTPGVGTKAQADTHLAQYNSLKTLNSDNVKQDTSINHVTGASVSSGAIHKAVYCALEQFKKMGGAK